MKTEKSQHDENHEPLCVDIPTAARLLGVSRNTAYSMVRMNQLPVIKCGQRRLLVPKMALMKKLQEAGSNNSCPGSIL